MNTPMIAMIVLNAYLVAWLFTFVVMYIRTTKELGGMTTLYHEKSDAWLKEVDRNVDLIRENELLKHKIKKLESKK